MTRVIHGEPIKLRGIRVERDEEMKQANDLAIEAFEVFMEMLSSVESPIGLEFSHKRGRFSMKMHLEQEL